MMRSDHDAMMVVRSELCARLETLRRFSDRRAAGEMADSIAGIRRLAQAYGLTPVVRISEAFERAMSEPDLACRKSVYLDRLDDAIGCQRIDEAASQAMIASITVRFG